MTRASANATTLPLEPAAIGLAALTSAITASASVAHAADVGPIEAAYPDWMEKTRAFDYAANERYEIGEKYVEPERPAWHFVLSEGGYITLPGNRPGRYRCCLDDSDKNVARLRDLIARKPVDGWDETMLARAAERAKITLDKIITWRAERDRRRSSIGLDAAEERENYLEKLSEEAAEAILAGTPSTFREAAFQAAVLDLNWNDRAAFRLISNLRKLAGIPAYCSDDEED